jgi:hypothetical protein
MMRKWAIFGTVVVGSVCLAVLGVVWAHPEMLPQDKFSQSAEDEAKTRGSYIQAEIAAGRAPDWAGRYYMGDGLGVGVSLSLAGQAGFVFEWHGCMGVYDRNYGPVTVKDHTILLSCTFPNEERGFKGIATELIPISWGSRKYVIPPNDLVKFCNSVNSGDEPRNDIHGFHLLRQGDEKKPVQGWPAVPAEFEHYLLKKSIDTEIVAVGTPRLRPSIVDWKFKDTPVTLKGGKDIGLRPGMELHVVSKDTSDSIVIGTILVGVVDDHTSQGLMTGIGEESQGPKVGWKLSTKWRDAGP